MKQYIREMAKKAKLYMTSPERVEAVEKFAALVAAHEREECAKVCEAQYRDYEWATHERDGAESCAAAIRARGQE
jgi:hypothetical protein